MRILFVILALLFINTAQAQVSYQLLPESEGLPTKEVYQVFCDSKGYLWVGHAKGISRYNGNRFTHYSHPLQNSLGVSNIKEDADGRIWFRNFGAQIFYIENNEMKLLEEYDWKSQATFPGIAIQNNQLLATHRDGIFVYDIKTKASKVIRPKAFDGTLTNVVLEYLPDTQAIFLWHNNMASYRNGEIKDIFINPKHREALGKHNSLSSMSNDSLYFFHGIQDSLMVGIIQNDTFELIRHFSSPKGVHEIIKLDQNNLWLCSKTGAINLNNNKQYIAHLGVSSMCNDKTGNTWFSTLQGGIGYFSNINQSVPFSQIQLKQSDIIQYVDVHNEQLVISTNLGSIYSISKNNNYHKSQVPVKQNLVYFYSDKNKIWSGGMYLIELDHLFNLFKTIEDPIYIKEITSDNKGNVYMATALGLIEHTNNNSFRNIRKTRCKSVVWMDNSPFMYCAFTDGIFKFNNAKEEKELLIKGNSMNAVNILSFGDTLAVATLNDGVYLFVNDKVVSHYTVDNLLLSNQIDKIKFFNNQLWVLTSGGLTSIDLKSEKVNNYTYGYMLQQNDIKDFTIWNDKLIIANVNQVYSLDILKGNNTDAPRIFLDGIKINGRDTILKSGWSASHKFNNISFTISGVSLKSGRNLFYNYRLLGADTAWQSIPSGHFMVEFPSLSPGKYNFQIKAISADGISSEMLTHTFMIKNPWWKQYWFYGAVLLFLASLIYIYFKLSIRSVKKKNELLLDRLNLQSDLRESMLTAIKSQMNPHFIFNALNTIQSFIYTSDENKASNYLGKFSDLIRMILNNSQKKEVTLKEEIKMLRIYIDLELMRFEGSMEVNIDVDNRLTLDQIMLPPMLIQPYVENAIKHGLLHLKENRKLNLQFKLSSDKNYLEVYIVDNGVGRAVSLAINKQRHKKHSSFSTIANQNRLDLINQMIDKKIMMRTVDLYDQNKKPNGTKVILTIPL